ncbi:MAG: hypothetical protein HQK79_05795 [Desulfobacterales bacterium]|nr:hypothetical protein [Desulfobacterales bacterium]MBF0395494.1 hypothetical protein [Desulfobacterales bacterium]
MDREIVWKVSDNLYDEMIKVQEELSFPDLIDLISQAVQRYIAETQHETWRFEFRKLQKQVHSSGGFQLGQTKEQVIAKLREQRHQIFESDYAHMYR